MLKSNITGENIITIANHAVNALMKTKRKNGSDMPDKFNCFDVIQNSITESIRIKGIKKPLKKTDTVSFKSYNGYIDSTSRDDLRQIACLAICEALNTTESLTDEQLFTIAYKAVLSKWNSIYYNTNGRYQYKLKKIKLNELKDRKAGTYAIKGANADIEQIEAILNYVDSNQEVKIIDYTTGPAYNQLIMLEAKNAVPLQTDLIWNDKESYILNHLSGEYKKLYGIIKQWYESNTRVRNTPKVEYIKKNMCYPKDMTRFSVRRRIQDLYKEYRKYADEYEIETAYSDNYSKGLTRRDSSKESVNYLNYLKRKPTKAKKTIKVATIVKVNSDYVSKMNIAHDFNANSYETISVATKTTEYDNTDFGTIKPVKRRQITSIADVRNWKPKEVKKTELVPLETLLSVLDSKSATQLDKECIREYINKHYPDTFNNNK